MSRTKIGKKGKTGKANSNFRGSFENALCYNEKTFLTRILLDPKPYTLDPNSKKSRWQGLF
jgi:hypothetical protein